MNKFMFITSWIMATGIIWMPLLELILQPEMMPRSFVIGFVSSFGGLLCLMGLYCGGESHE